MSKFTNYYYNVHIHTVCIHKGVPEDFDHENCSLEELEAARESMMVILLPSTCPVENEEDPNDLSQLYRMIEAEQN